MVQVEDAAQPTLLWLWYRLAAVALIRPLDWELPCAAGLALKKKKTCYFSSFQMILAIF